MSQPVRRSSRTLRRNAGNVSYSDGEPRNASCEKPQKRKRKSVFEQDPEEKRTKSASSETVVKIQRKVVNGQHVDSFCWICHKLVDDLSCSDCSRAYHKDCLIKKKVPSLELNFCDCRLKTVDGCAPISTCTPPELAELLKFAMKEAVTETKKSHHKSQKAENDKFCKFFKTWPFIEENKILLKIIDIDVLIDKIHQAPPYQSTGNFFLDVKWIYHNCCIIYGADDEITETALKLEKKIKQELLDIEACRECYRNKHTIDPSYCNYFAMVCQRPHKIVWAKLRGSAYWPAKCLKIHNGHADVRFFGTHDKSSIKLDQVYYISRAHPEDKNFNKMAKLKEAINELTDYIDIYENSQGRSFEFFDKRVSINEAHPQSKKKQRKKGRNSATHAECLNIEEKSCVEMKPKIISTKVKGFSGTLTSGGLNVNIASGLSEGSSSGSTSFATTSTGTGLFEQNTHNETGLGQLEMKPKIVLTKMKNPFVAKVEANLHEPGYFANDFPRREHQNVSESIDDASSELRYELTFTSDDNMSSVVNDDPFQPNSIQLCPVSKKCLKTEKLSSFNEVAHYSSGKALKNEFASSSLNESSDDCSETPLSPPCTDIHQIKLGNFTNNVNESVPFPVITSTQSAIEIENHVNESFPVITSTQSAIELENNVNESVELENNSAPIPDLHENHPAVTDTFENCPISETDCPNSEVNAGASTSDEPASSAERGADDDKFDYNEEDVQVLNEVNTNPLIDHVGRKSSVSALFCELLLASRPTLIDGFKKLQNASQEFFLKIWLDMQTNTMITKELRTWVQFLDQYQELREDYLNVTKEVAELKKKNSSQEAQIKSLLDKKNQKDALRDEIIKASAIKLRNKEMDLCEKIKELQQKIKVLEEMNKELTDNDKLKESNIQFEDKYLSLCENYKELNAYLETVEKKCKQFEKENDELKRKLEKEEEEKKRCVLHYENKVKKLKCKQKILNNEKCVKVATLKDNLENSGSVREETVTISASNSNKEESNSHSVFIKHNNVSAVSSSHGTRIYEESLEQEFVPTSPVSQMFQVSPYMTFPPTITCPDLTTVSTCPDLNTYLIAVNNISLQPGTSGSSDYNTMNYNPFDQSSCPAVHPGAANLSSGSLKTSRVLPQKVVRKTNKGGAYRPKKGSGPSK